MFFIAISVRYIKSRTRMTIKKEIVLNKLQFKLGGMALFRETTEAFGNAHSSVLAWESRTIPPKQTIPSNLL